MKRILLLVITLVTATCAQESVQINALFPPMGPGNRLWDDFNKYVLKSALVDGFNPGLDWANVETSQGVYDFSKFDRQVEHFSQTGKKINIIVRPVTNGGSNRSTPDYVFSASWAKSVGASPLDVMTCHAYHGDGSRNSGFPVVYEAPFKVAYKNFVAAVLKHYANDKQIGYIRFGLAVGGEVFPWCIDDMKSLRSPNTFSKSVWLNYINEMENFEESKNSTHIQLMAAINQARDGNHWDVSYADEEAKMAVAHGQGFGCQGWQESDIDASKQGKSCTSDWCALFEKYAGQVPLELQQAGETSPNGGNAGLMSDLVPLALEHHGNIFEIYARDLLLALDPNYPAHTQYGAAYREAFERAHGGAGKSGKGKRD
jgi:hypothetical protein